MRALRLPMGRVNIQGEAPPRHSAPSVGSPTNLENSGVLQLLFGCRESSDNAPVFPRRAEYVDIACIAIQCS
jgi:hypothetical protein